MDESQTVVMSKRGQVAKSKIVHLHKVLERAKQVLGEK